MTCAPRRAAARTAGRRLLVLQSVPEPPPPVHLPSDTICIPWRTPADQRLRPWSAVVRQRNGVTANERRPQAAGVRAEAGTASSDGNDEGARFRVRYIRPGAHLGYPASDV